jgi:hypothetical protein
VLEDLEILDRLPTDSPVRGELASHIDASIRRLITGEDELRRDPGGVVLGIILLAFGAIGVWLGWRNRADVWGWPVLVVALCFATLGAYGAARDSTKMRRDERGRPVQG